MKKAAILLTLLSLCPLPVTLTAQVFPGIPEISEATLFLPLPVDGPPNLSRDTIEKQARGEEFTPRYIHWVNTYDHGTNGHDEARKLAIAPDGNIWVTGAVESGVMNSDIYTVIYDQDGNVVNDMLYDGASHGNDVPSDIIIDDRGFSYITGSTWDASTQEDYLLLCYDLSGTLVWEASYDGPAGDIDVPAAIALDQNGNIGVTGSSYSGFLQGEDDYCTVIWDDSGTELCVERYNGAFYLGDFGRSITFDSEGSFIVTGNALQGWSQYDITTLKYDASCNRLWESTFNGPIDEGDYAVKVLTDSFDNIFICGYSRSGVSHRDYLVLKYNPDGQLVWSKRYNGPGWSEDYTADMVLDGNGNIYVTGKSRGNNHDYDIATVKLTPAGNQVWATRFNRIGRCDDEGKAMTLDQDGNVYVAGTSFDKNEGNTDIVILKHAPDGALLWVRYLKGQGDDGAADIGQVAGDGLYVTGTLSNGIGGDTDISTVKVKP